MWTRQVFGVESYYIIQWFLLYSILGWCVESLYMSICNRKLTNRGFVRGPMCPIYGVGALSVYFMLRSFEGHYMFLYVSGAILATAFEYLVAKLMQRTFGEVWWDYSEKPFNYRGIICLESTLAWGFYTLFMFLFLQRFVERIVGSYGMTEGIFFGKIVIFIFLIDLFSTIYQVRQVEDPDYVDMENQSEEEHEVEHPLFDFFKR